ncbi:MAG TPA: FG-GAP-like repeat-containing protein, partial [Cyclobacteriaceae bacterium]|nr:FG-GAP-like repeat-containing protein [Cyclobacteriaceae bacterium]
YVNITQPGEALQWRAFNSGLPVFTKGFSGNINLKFNETDIPVIDDVDGDGDLDILNIQFVSNSDVEYHKNMSLEQTGNRDTLIFERITQTFGNFKECDCGVFAFQGEDCPDIANGRLDHAGGKALLYIDLDQDGVKDLLFSEELCRELYFLKNIGSNENPVFSEAQTFPSSVPVNMPFPAAYYEDIDFDGVPDLLVAPNLYFRQFIDLDFERSAWMYKNSNTSLAPVFNFVQENFLQHQMIDVGEQAIVAFADEDNDGDLDMFISHNGTPRSTGNIILYENIGSNTEPAFRLKTTNYYPPTFGEFYNLKISFADVNADGRTDLVFTATANNDGITRLYYAANTSNGAFNFIGADITNTGISFALNENIHLHDINNDGRLDLLIGKANGAVEYWRNTGTASSVSFVQESAAYKGLGPSILRQFPAVFVADLDADGKKDLLLGDQSGTISIVSDIINISNVNEFIREIVFDESDESYYTRNFGGRIWPVAANLFGSNKPAIIVGNALGGVSILQASDAEPQDEAPLIRIYPNPVVRSEYLNLRVNRNATLRIINSIGQTVERGLVVPANTSIQLETAAWAPGVYFAQFFINQKNYARRFVVTR